MGQQQTTGMLCVHGAPEGRNVTVVEGNFQCYDPSPATRFFVIRITRNESGGGQVGPRDFCFKAANSNNNSLLPLFCRETRWCLPSR